MPAIEPEHFTQALYELLDEAFDNVHGHFLDPGTHSSPPFRASALLKPPSRWAVNAPRWQRR